MNIKALGDTAISIVTNDEKKVLVEGTVLLRLDMEQIPMIWQWIGEDFVAKIIRPTIQSRIRMVASRYNLTDIVSSKRDLIEDEIKHELERILYPRGIRVENVLLSEIVSH